jgi:hypothetical protein
MTHDEKQSILNAINSMQRIGLFCEICRNATCICKIGDDSSIINALDDFNMNFLTPKENSMTPKEKAKELVDKIYYSRRYEVGESYIPKQVWDHAKQSAIIAVNEILDLPQIASFRRDKVYMEMEYWGEVIKEIEKL